METHLCLHSHLSVPLLNLAFPAPSVAHASGALVSLKRIPDPTSDLLNKSLDFDKIAKRLVHTEWFGKQGSRLASTLS